jgi:hypothetical protein
MVVGGTQNHLRICRKNLCGHGEDAKRHNTEEISVNRSFLSVQDGLNEAKKNSRYYPFKGDVTVHVPSCT